MFLLELMNLLKKALLCAAVPLMMGSCQLTLLTTNSKQHNRQYESRLLHKVKNRNDLSSLSDRDLINYWSIKFRNSTYSSLLGIDSDGDGIINADDIWKYRYGPFVDSNGNGIVDMFDWQIDGFNSSYINNYPYRIHERWFGLDLNPFWFREYTHRHTNYFNIHKKHRHHEKKYIRHHVVRDNKRRASYNTTTRRDNTNRRATTTTRRIPITRQNTRSTQTRRTTPTKKRSDYISPIKRNKRSVDSRTRRIKKSEPRKQTRTFQTRRVPIKKSTQVKRTQSKGQSTKRRN